MSLETPKQRSRRRPTPDFASLEHGKTFNHESTIALSPRLEKRSYGTGEIVDSTLGGLNASEQPPDERRAGDTPDDRASRKRI
jgi:hypothetical protein